MSMAQPLQNEIGVRIGPSLMRDAHQEFMMHGSSAQLPTAMEPNPRKLMAQSLRLAPPPSGSYSRLSGSR